MVPSLFAIDETVFFSDDEMDFNIDPQEIDDVKDTSVIGESPIKYDPTERIRGIANRKRILRRPVDLPQKRSDHRTEKL